MQYVRDILLSAGPSAGPLLTPEKATEQGLRGHLKLWHEVEMEGKDLFLTLT